jgi:hypothetical protein
VSLARAAGEADRGHYIQRHREELGAGHDRMRDEGTERRQLHRLAGIYTGREIVAGRRYRNSDARENGEQRSDDDGCARGRPPHRNRPHEGGNRKQQRADDPAH